MKFYPSYLPKPLINYSLSNDNRTIQTSFESGRISQRSLSTTQRDLINVVFQYNFFQLGAWESFVQTTLSNGALEFTIDLPDSVAQQIIPTIVLLSEGKYSISSASGSIVWKVTASLIRQDKPSFTQEDLDLLEGISGDYKTVIDYSNLFHNFAQETLYEIQ